MDMTNDEEFVEEVLELFEYEHGSYYDHIDVCLACEGELYFPGVCKLEKGETFFCPHCGIGHVITEVDPPYLDMTGMYDTNFVYEDDI